MSRIIFTLLLTGITSLGAFAQSRYFTKTGMISFHAGTSVEDIDAINKSAASVMDAGTGQIEFSVLVKGFEFKRALMQEHFNENYLESDKFPKAVFKGKLVNADKIKFQQDGVYPVTVKGTLEMHGVKRDVESAGTMKIAGQQVDANATFNVLLSEYDISVPSVVKDKISKTVTIKVQCNYNLLK